MKSSKRTYKIYHEARAYSQECDTKHHRDHTLVHLFALEILTLFITIFPFASGHRAVFSLMLFNTNDLTFTITFRCRLPSESSNLEQLRKIYQRSLSPLSKKPDKA
jgi:hypothetical protein